MHSKCVMHRDLKLENIVFNHVVIKLLREWLKFVISDGLFMSQKNFEKPFVEHHYTFPLKFLLGKNIVQRQIFGL